MAGGRDASDGPWELGHVRRHDPRDASVASLSSPSSTTQSSSVKLKHINQYLPLKQW